MKENSPAAAQAETPSASVNSTITVRCVPDPLLLAIFHGLASRSSHTRAIIFTGKFKQVSGSLKTNNCIFLQDPLRHNELD